MTNSIKVKTPIFSLIEERVNEPRRIMNKLRSNKIILSFGSEDTYLSCFKRIKSFLDEKKKGSLRKLSMAFAIQFLKKYRYIFKHNTLKKYRQALQHLLRFYGRLGVKQTLPTFKSMVPHKERSRAYTYEQMLDVCKCMSARNALAVKICYFAGLRAHELLEIRYVEERSPHRRPANATKFLGHEGKRYTVKGKTGLVRLVMLPQYLADALEKRRLTTSEKVKDRKIIYETFYDVGAGKKLSNAFSAASKRAHGWSRGLHGLRHSYAQNRYKKLCRLVDNNDLALETVSQELGHFRKSITKVYLR